MQCLIFYFKICHNDIFKFIYVLFIVSYGLHYNNYSKYICSIYVHLVLRFSDLGLSDYCFFFARMGQVVLYFSKKIHIK